MSNYLFLNEEFIHFIHEQILEQSYGLIGMRTDLAGVISRIDASIHYKKAKNVFDIAALYAIAIAQGHPFNDGNKRTAMISMYNFLFLNGYKLNSSDKTIENKMVAIAEKKISQKQLKRWLKKKCQPIG